MQSLLTWMGAWSARNPSVPDRDVVFDCTDAVSLETVYRPVKPTWHGWVQRDEHPGRVVQSLCFELLHPIQYHFFSYHLMGRSETRIEQTIQVRLASEKAAFHWHHLTLGTEGTFNQRLEIEHLAPETTFSLQHRALWLGTAQGFFQGHIHVHPTASETHSTLMQKNLLLGSKAQITTQPEFEIENRQVVCTHGATVGFLDEAAIFYLQSRGIEATEARLLLIDSFLGPVWSNRWPEWDEKLQEVVKAQVRAHL